MLKLYTYDGGWQGSVSIVATNRDEAFCLFLNSANQYIRINKSSELEEHDLNQIKIVMMTEKVTN